jgi:PAN domain
MRYLNRWCAVAILAVLAAVPAPARAQTGFDRPGGDYTSLPERSRDPAACAARCDRDARCRAWAFVYPAAGGQGSVCWLKNQVPARVENACCASGVKGAGVSEPRRARDGAVELGIDRYGGDYRSFDTKADPNGSDCKTACEGENRCRAWTYVRPGYLSGSSGARCYLKDRIRPPRRKPCCVSGVVR